MGYIKGVGSKQTTGDKIMLEKSGKIYGYSELIVSAIFHKIDLIKVEEIVRDVEKDLIENKWIEDSYFDKNTFVIPVQTKNNGIVHYKIEIA